MNIPIQQHGGRVGSAVQQLVNYVVRMIALLIGWQIDSVANVAALATVDDSRIPDGSQKLVRTLWDTWTLDKTSTSATDNITVIATASGTGRWIRDIQPNAERWGNQTTWYIDADNGDDENDGNTDSTELATWEEFRRRVEPGGVLDDMTVYIETDLPNTILFVGGGQSTLTIEGVPTTVYTGTVNTFAFTPATNTPPTLNDAGWTVADHVGQHVRFTSGDADGMGAWIAEADYGGAGNARLSCVTPENYWDAAADPNPADTFVVETFPSANATIVYDGTCYVNKLDGYLYNNSKWAYMWRCGTSSTMVGSGGSGVATDCFGAVGFENNVYSSLYGGLYGRITVGSDELNLGGVPPTLDSGPGAVQRSSMYMLPGSYAMIYTDFWVFGPIGPYAQSHYFHLYHKSSMVMDGGRFRGETPDGELFEVKVGSSLYTNKLDHSVTPVLSVIPADGAELELNQQNTFGGAVGRVQKMTHTFTEADLTAAAATETLDLGYYRLPGGSTIVGVDMYAYTPFTGGTISDFTVDIGSSADPDAIVDGADLYAGAVAGGVSSMPAGIRPNKFFDSTTQLTAKFDCASDDVADATAGAVTIDVYYTIRDEE